MKYAVTIETEVEFEFAADVDKDELLKEFCECIFETDMLGLERFIAERIAIGDDKFIEGVGKINWKYWLEDNTVVYFNSNRQVIETEKL